MRSCPMGRAFASICHMVQTSTNMASTKKTVVVQLDRFNRKIELDCSGKENETDALMKKVKIGWLPV